VPDSLLLYLGILPVQLDNRLLHPLLHLFLKLPLPLWPNLAEEHLLLVVEWVLYLVLFREGLGWRKQIRLIRVYHPLVGVLLAEQTFRSISIRVNHLLLRAEEATTAMEGDRKKRWRMRLFRGTRIDRV
jgi:hypothetical protein